MSHTLSRLRSYLILDPLIFLYTGFFVALSLVSSLFDPNGTMQHKIARTWSRLILFTCASPVTVIGMEHIDPTRAHVYAANHLSAMDIPVLYASLPVQFRVVALIDIFRYPLVGWHLRRSGQIPINMSTPRATFKSLHGGIEDLRKGLSVLIFPEGGRSPSGELRAFMNGAFYMATKAQVDVVPLAIVGTFEMLPMNTFHIMPRRLELHVGKPISTAGLTTHHLEELSAMAREAIAGMYCSARHSMQIKKAVPKDGS